MILKRLEEFGVIATIVEKTLWVAESRRNTYEGVLLSLEFG
jgi:hypothetical protein